jgi:flagellar protein FlbD
MILLTRIDGRQITVNADEIEIIESSHDSAITLKSGRVVIVRESPEEIVDKVIDYRQKCAQKPALPSIDKY